MGVNFFTRTRTFEQLHNHNRFPWMSSIWKVWIMTYGATTRHLYSATKLRTGKSSVCCGCPGEDDDFNPCANQAALASVDPGEQHRSSRSAGICFTHMLFSSPECQLKFCRNKERYFAVVSKFNKGKKCEPFLHLM